jgi:predicted DsbA family dithiol-disulfide isomerase
MEYTRNTIDYVKNMAKEVGLNYDFERAVVANSFDAHRLIQFAKSKGKGDLAEEHLFKAYFIEGKNTADHQVLLGIAKEIGLDLSETKSVLESDQFAQDVNQDIAESEKLGISGVPFFVINRQYGISGAQDSQVFLDTLNKAWTQLQH